MIIGKKFQKKAGNYCQFKKNAYLCIANAKNGCIFLTIFAKIAQLVEHNLAKVGVAGSSPVFRSTKF